MGLFILNEEGEPCRGILFFANACNPIGIDGMTQPSRGILTAFYKVPCTRAGIPWDCISRPESNSRSVVNAA